MAESPSSAAVFARRRLVLCVGPGGVGKTTNAAALALHAAKVHGRKVAVVTIDPARRLAQALGIDGIDPSDGGNAGSESRASDLVALSGEDLGLPEGARLDALILDGGRVFDTIVRECASDAASAQSILDSRIYQAMAERLSGALEFAAMARVQMLLDAGEHDLIVLDTPPTANAMDFLEAPSRIRELIDNPGARLLAGTGRIGARILGLGTSVLTRTLEAMGGGAFIRDLGTFLREISGVLQEFTRRGGDFEQALRSPSTGVLLVTAATTFSVREAGVFLDQLDDYGLNIDAVVLNRLEPKLPAPPQRDAVEAALDSAGLDARARVRAWSVYDGAQAQGRASEAAVATIAAQRPGVRIWTAPRYPEPPDTLPALVQLGASIFGE